MKFIPQSRKDLEFLFTHRFPKYSTAKTVGNIGCGTHYSVIFTIVLYDEHGSVFTEPHICLIQAIYHDFVLIWDWDHNTRIMDVVPKLRAIGLLPMFNFFGERKGAFSAHVRKDSGVLRHFATQQIETVFEDNNGDYWT